MLKWNSK